MPMVPTPSTATVSPIRRSARRTACSPDAEGLQHRGVLKGHPGRHGVAHALGRHHILRECADPFPHSNKALLGALVIVALPAVDAAAAPHVRLQRYAVPHSALGGSRIPRPTISPANRAP